MTTHFGSAGRTRGSASIQFPRSSFIHYFRFRIFENFAARAHRFGRILFVCWRFQVNCVDTTLLTSDWWWNPPRQSFRPISSVRRVTWPAVIQLKRKIELNFLLSKSRPISYRSGRWRWQVEFVSQSNESVNFVSHVANEPASPSLAFCLSVRIS